MDKWINSRCQSEQHILRALCEKYVHGAIRLIIDGMLGLQVVTPLKMIIPQTGLNMVMRLDDIHFFSSLIAITNLQVTQLCVTINVLYPKPAIDEFLREEGKVLSDEEEVAFNERVLARDETLEAVYLQACYCSLGAAITSESRNDFDEYMKKTSGLMMIEDSAEKPATTRYLPALFPQLYDYLLDVERRIWVPWNWLVSKYEHDRGKFFGEILVPTVDTMRASWFVSLMNKWKKPVVLVGDTGTSKSAIVMDFLRHLNTEKFVS